MEDLPSDINVFLVNHPFLELTQDGKKIKCTLNGHDFPCNLTELQNFTKGKKYQKLSSTAEFNYSQYEPHVVPSSKQPNHLFCKLTLRHINRLPHHVLRHVNGKRFLKAKKKYEMCVQQGVDYIPASLRQKKSRDRDRDVDGERGRQTHRGSGAWAPDSSDNGGSDSEDSMSDLYPSSFFTLKNETEEGMEKDKEDDFQTDDDDNDEAMEVDKEATQKRKKVQAGGLKKKCKNHNWKRKGLKTNVKLNNGK